MKNEFLIVILASLMSFCTLIAQKSLPLKFDKGEVKWSELMWMEDINGHDNFFIANNPIIIDDTIYLFNNYRYNKQDRSNNNKVYGNSGYVIKKINVKTGEKYWEIKRHVKEYGNRRTLNQPKLVGSTLVVTLNDEFPTQGSEWLHCYPAHIVIDRQSGTIIDSNYVGKTDPLLRKVVVSANSFYDHGIPAKIHETDYGYNHIKYWLKEFTSTKLDFSGHLLSIDTIKNPPKSKYVTGSMLLDKLDNDSIWLVNANRISYYDQYNMQFIFSKYDSEMNLDTTYDLTPHFTFPIEDVFAAYIDGDYIVIRTNVPIDRSMMRIKTYSYLFDKNGNFVDSIAFVITNEEYDKIGSYGWFDPLVDKVNKRMMWTYSRQYRLTESTVFDLYVNDGDSIKSVVNIRVEGIDDHFRVRYGRMLDNGDILLYIRQFADPGDPIRATDVWYSWILLDGSKMNIVSSTKDEANVSNKLILYPNPATNNISIANLDAPATVTIFNINGQILKQLSNIENEVNISDLPAGIYIFDITNKALSERHKVVKVGE